MGCPNGAQQLLHVHLNVMYVYMYAKLNLKNEYKPTPFPALTDLQANPIPRVDRLHSLFSAGLSGDASLGELPVVDRLASPQLGRVAVPFSAASSGSSANTSKFEPKHSRERAR